MERLSEFVNKTAFSSILIIHPLHTTFDMSAYGDDDSFVLYESARIYPEIAVFLFIISFCGWK